MRQREPSLAPSDLPLGVVCGKVEGVDHVPGPVADDPLHVAERPQPCHCLR